jgi:hypothetical protein
MRRNPAEYASRKPIFLLDGLRATFETFDWL